MSNAHKTWFSSNIQKKDFKVNITSEGKKIVIYTKCVLGMEQTRIQCHYSDRDMVSQQQQLFLSPADFTGPFTRSPGSS